MRKAVISGIMMGIMILGATLVLGQLSAGYAESIPASKATAKVSDLTLLDWQKTDTSKTVPWTTLLSSTIKTSQQKDLFVDASLEAGLYTNTLVRSKDMISDTSTSTASIKVRVLVDGREAYPGEVVFAKRSQTLSATLQGQLALMDINGDGIVGFDELVSIAPEEISLVLDTMNANSFNFVLNDVGVGVHTIEVQAQIDLGAQVQAGAAEARALIGKGSVTVEEVRMIKDAEVLI